MTQRTRQARRRAANLLFLAGVLGVGLWVWANIRGAVYQSWANWAFEREKLGQAATVIQYLRAEGEEAWDHVRAWCGLEPVPRLAVPLNQASRVPSWVPAIGDGDLIGRLVVPRLHLRAIVREGTGANTLAVALGHIPGTALPGENGNACVAGHRDTLFRRLGQIRRNDVVRFQTLGGDFLYKVESTGIVTPRNTDVLRKGQAPEITLVTCYPFHFIGPAPDRFVVKARLVASTAR